MVNHGFITGGGGEFGRLLDILAQAGFFSFVLPFLVIFSLVYGILLKTNIFKDNNIINGVISFSVGLLALQFNAVPIFFSQIFPRLGVALAVILVVIILLGIFLPRQNWIIFVLFFIAAIALIATVLPSLQETFGFQIGFYGIDLPLIIAAATVIIPIWIIIVVLSKKPKAAFEDIQSPFLRALMEGNKKS